MSTTTPVADSEFVASRSVGEATVTVVSDGVLLWAPRFPVPEAEWRRELPDADGAGRVRFGLNVVLVQLGEARVVVDPALDDPGTAFDRGFAKAVDVAIERSPGLAAALAELGWAPEAVTHVVITHAHGDHYAGVVAERDGQLEVRFPNARHYIGRADWDGNPQREQPNSELSRRLGAVARRGLLEPVEGEREILPGLTLLPAPGESPGHLVVRVRSGGEAVYVLGDLAHHACEVSHPDWAPPGRDLAALRASRDRLYPEMAREGALAVTAHERFPPWGRVVSAGEGYRWETV